MAEGNGMDELGEFKPCFIYHPELDLLEWLTEDVGTVAESVGPPHAADVLWNFDRTKIVGVQMWGVVAAIRNSENNKARFIAEMAICQEIAALVRRTQGVSGS